MSAEQNKAVVRRWFDEVWNQQRSSTIDELLAPAGLVNGLSPDGAGNGPPAFRPFWQQFVGAFPDIRIAVEDAIAEEDMVAARIRFTGTHRGNHLGTPPTGKPVTGTGLVLVRIRNGQIAESWNEFDALKIFLETGVVRMVNAPQ